jgi:two-component system chemotaxis response regulator CheY
MLENHSTILIVDDQKLARTLLIKALNGNGYTNIIEAENGKEALELMKKTSAAGSSIDLIFIDINMPEMDGMELLSYYKTNKEWEKIPIVMVTAETEIHIVVQALKAGALDYIKKPVSIDSLKDKIKFISQKLT